jgi:hypothetical protein
MVRSGGGRLQYSGWNCMKSTLLKKGLVFHHKRMKPQRYSLTSEGRAIAKKLHVYARKMALDNGDHDSNDFDVSDMEADEQIQTLKKNKTTRKSKMKSSIQGIAERQAIVLEASYVDNALELVSNQDQASVKIVETGLAFLLRVKTDTSANIDEIQRKIFELERHEENTIYAWILEQGAPYTSVALLDYLSSNVITSESEDDDEKPVIEKVSGRKRKLKDIIEDENSSEEILPRKNSSLFIDYRDYLTTKRKTIITESIQKQFSPHYELSLLIDQREKANRDRRAIISSRKHSSMSIRTRRYDLDSKRWQYRSCTRFYS